MKEHRRRALEHYDKLLGIMQPDLEREQRQATRLYGKNWLGHLPRARDARILDLGSGFGLFLHFLSGEGYTAAEGVDGSAACVRLCGERGLRVTHHADLQQYLTERPGEFDCIVMNHLIEHFEKDEAVLFLDVVKLALRDDGTLLMVTPNMANPITASRSRYADLTHEVGYTQESLRGLLSLCGFAEPTFAAIDIYLLDNALLNLGGRIAWWCLSRLWRVAYLLNGVRTVDVFSKHILCVASRQDD